MDGYRPLQEVNRNTLCKRERGEREKERERQTDRQTDKRKNLTHERNTGPVNQTENK